MRRMVREWPVLRLAVVLSLVVALFLMVPMVASAATTANITVNATPAFVGISCNVASYDYGVVAASSTTNTTTSYFGITDSSTVQTDQTIGVTGNWTGGTGWTHAEDGNAGADTAGLLANLAGTWGVSDIIVKYASPNYIYENNTAGNDYAFGLGLQAPTSYSDGAEKTVTVQVTASQG